MKYFSHGHHWVSGRPSQGESLHPLLLPAWFASITTAPFLPTTCVPLSSLHVCSCQEFGLEMTSPASQTFLFCTLKSLWNLARLPKLSLSSLVTLLNIKHFYCISHVEKKKGKQGKGRKQIPAPSVKEEVGIAQEWIRSLFFLLLSPLHVLSAHSEFLLGYLPLWKTQFNSSLKELFQADPEGLGNGKTHPTVDPAPLPKEKTVF